MPVHDWTRVDDGIFHDFHHGWIEEIKRTLNAGILPGDYYALAEQFASGGPDVLTLEGPPNGSGASDGEMASSGDGSGVLLAPPKIRLTAETDMEFYRRKQKVVAVRHVSGDNVVAVIEVVSPGNKSGRRALRSFVEKATWLIGQQVHLIILDLQPPTKRDPRGIHGVIWEELTGEDDTAPSEKPLTLAAYESGLSVKAYVERFRVGEELAEMPLFLEPGAHVQVPLEMTYQNAYSFVPKRWQRILNGSASR